jgi:hypothetical protein
MTQRSDSKGERFLDKVLKVSWRKSSVVRESGSERSLSTWVRLKEPIRSVVLWTIFYLTLMLLCRECSRGKYFGTGRIA